MNILDAYPRLPGVSDLLLLLSQVKDDDCLVSVAINYDEEDDDVCPIGYSEEISDGWWVIGANDLARRIARHVPPSIWPADTPVSPSSPPRNRIRVRFARGACRLSFLPIANPPI